LLGDVEPESWSSLIREALKDRLKAVDTKLGMLAKELRNNSIKPIASGTPKLYF
jgi:hypothetical protein